MKNVKENTVEVDLSLNQDPLLDLDMLDDIKKIVNDLELDLDEINFDEIDFEQMDEKWTKSMETLENIIIRNNK